MGNDAIEEIASSTGALIMMFEMTVQVLIDKGIVTFEDLDRAEKKIKRPEIFRKILGNYYSDKTVDGIMKAFEEYRKA